MLKWTENEEGVSETRLPGILGAGCIRVYPAGGGRYRCSATPSREYPTRKEAQAMGEQVFQDKILVLADIFKEISNESL